MLAEDTRDVLRRTLHEAKSPYRIKKTSPGVFDIHFQGGVIGHVYVDKRRTRNRSSVSGYVVRNNYSIDFDKEHGGPMPDIPTPDMDTAKRRIHKRLRKLGLVESTNVDEMFTLDDIVDSGGGNLYASFYRSSSYNPRNDDKVQRQLDMLSKVATSARRAQDKLYDVQDRFDRVVSRLEKLGVRVSMTFGDLIA